MGDKYDLLSFSKFPRRLIHTPKDEIEEARQLALSMWDRLQRASPRNAKCFQLKGNHDQRAYKRVLEKLPEIECLIDFKSLWSFSRVETIYDDQQTLELKRIHFLHGFRTKIGDHLKQLEFKNCVTGHLHRGGVVYHRLDTGKIVWEANAGYIGDPFSEALNYRNTKRFFSWTHGCLVIDEQGPKFIPYPARRK